MNRTGWISQSSAGRARMSRIEDGIFNVHDIMTAWLEFQEADVHIGQVRMLETDEPIATGRDPEGHRFSIRALRKE